VPHGSHKRDLEQRGFIPASNEGDREMDDWFTIWRVQVAVCAYKRKSGPVRKHLRGWPRQYRLPGI